MQGVGAKNGMQRLLEGPINLFTFQFCVLYGPNYPHFWRFLGPLGLFELQFGTLMKRLGPPCSRGAARFFFYSRGAANEKSLGTTALDYGF